MTDDRAAKIEAMAKAMYEYGARHSWEEVAEVWREPYRQRAAAALDALAPWSLDALLDSVCPSATIASMGQVADDEWLVSIKWYRDNEDTWGAVALGNGPKRMDAIRNAVAQATTTQEGASNG